MRDPGEGLDFDGMITTGVRLSHIPVAYEPVLEAVISAMDSFVEGAGISRSGVELHLYGSVATGMARLGVSDVDLLTIGVPSEAASSISQNLSRVFASVCRGVEIGAVQPADYVGEDDVPYGNRVFLRHYCVPLWGVGAVRSDRAYPGDSRAARAFNGDIGNHLTQWRQMEGQVSSPALGRRIARKTLLAVAGLVSMHDRTWTTDRESSAKRCSDLRPLANSALDEMVAWSNGTKNASPRDIRISIQTDGIVASVVNEFTAAVGLWSASHVNMRSVRRTSYEHSPAVSGL